MNPKAKKRLLIVGGVVALGAVAYYLYDKSQAPALPPTPTGGGPLPQPRPVVATKPKATPGQIQAYKDAVNTLDKFAAYIQANPPQTQAELTAALAKKEELMAAVRRAAAAAGMTPTV